MRPWLLGLSLALLLPSTLFPLPSSALTYWSPSRYSKTINPGLACTGRKSFDLWTRKRYQAYQIKMYPRYIVRPCRRGAPNAEIRGWFESFQISGKANQACYGKFTMFFSGYGRVLKTALSYKGTLRGMSCPWTNTTQTIEFRPGR